MSEAVGETDLQRAFGGSCLGRTYTVDFQMPPKIKVLWGEKKKQNLEEVSNVVYFLYSITKEKFCQTNL